MNQHAPPLRLRPAERRLKDAVSTALSAALSATLCFASLISVTLISPAFAAPGPAISAPPKTSARASEINSAAVIQEIDAATGQIAAFMPWMRIPAIERALVRAVTQRGVRVTLITAQQTEWEQNSLVHNVLLAGYGKDGQNAVSLYSPKLSNVSQSVNFMIFDGRRVIIGNRLGLIEHIGENYSTTISTDPARIRSLASWMNRVISSTRPVTAKSVAQQIWTQQVR